MEGRRKRKIILLVIMLFFIIVLAVMSFLVFKLGISIAGAANLQPADLYSELKLTYFFRFIDELNPFKKKILDGALPVYDLKLSRNDIEFFDNLSKAAVERQYLSLDINKWRKAKLEFNGKEYDIEIRLRGDSATHWNDHLKSYSIKTAKEEYI